LHDRNTVSVKFVLIASADAADRVGPTGGFDAGNDDAKSAVALNNFRVQALLSTTMASLGGANSTGIDHAAAITLRR
jgi:hypothetical protein